MRLILWLVVGLIFEAQSVHASDPEQIALIGLDEEGNPVETFVSKKEYFQQLEQTLSAVKDSMMPVLKRRERRPGWKLRTVVVGVGGGIEAGLGPVIKVKVAPRFRLAFSNSKEAVIP